MNLAWNRELKKLTAAHLAVFLLFTVIVNLCIGIYGSRMRTEYNQFVASILGNVATAYPDVAEEELIQVLNGSTSGSHLDTGREVLAHYGIYSGYGSETFALQERGFFALRVCVNVLLLLFFVVCFLFVLLYLVKRQQRIYDMENYMEALNRENYKLYIADNTDDELSGLRNEVYKLTVFLKEQAKRAAEQKKVLADSVADISHQLKTPLTSITVLMDNLSENIDMDRTTRQHFMSEITRQITGMSWLVAVMLKISRLDAGVVELEREKINVRALVERALEKIEVAAEWKGVAFLVKIQEGQVYW